MDEGIKQKVQFFLYIKRFNSDDFDEAWFASQLGWLCRTSINAVIPLIAASITAIVQSHRLSKMVRELPLLHIFQRSVFYAAAAEYAEIFAAAQVEHRRCPRCFAAIEIRAHYVVQPEGRSLVRLLGSDFDV